MPIVFIHGVAQRRGMPGSESYRKYETSLKARHELLARITLTRCPAIAGPVTIVDPYWGDNAANFAWDLASLPGTGTEYFGDADDPVRSILTELYGSTQTTNPGTTLLGIAQTSFDDAIDLLFTAASELLTSDLTVEYAIAASKATSLRIDTQEYLLSAAESDLEFVDILLDLIRQSTSVEAFGGRSFVLETLKEGCGRISSTAARMTGKASAALLRSSISQKTALFIGDVLTYIANRDKAYEPDGRTTSPNSQEQTANGAILDTVADALVEANNSVSSSDPRVIVIAHSMGGNIAYDLLSWYRPDLYCHDLVTVGSQVGLFAELGLFKSVEQSCNPPYERVQALANVERWINIFDTADLLGFSTSRIFLGSRDYHYSTGKGLFKAHSTYFERPSFYRRLGERLAVPEYGP